MTPIADNSNEMFLLLTIDRFINYLVTDVLFCFIWLRFRHNGDVYSFYSQQEHENFSIFQTRPRIFTASNMSTSRKLTDGFLDDLRFSKLRETQYITSIQDHNQF